LIILVGYERDLGISLYVHALNIAISCYVKSSCFLDIILLCSLLFFAERFCIFLVD
jgi:hypothetical protein